MKMILHLPLFVENIVKLFQKESAFTSDSYAKQACSTQLNLKSFFCNSTGFEFCYLHSKRILYSVNLIFSLFETRLRR